MTSSENQEMSSSGHWQVRGVLTTRVQANKEAAFERVADLLEIMARNSANVRGQLLEMMDRIVSRLNELLRLR